MDNQNKVIDLIERLNKEVFTPRIGFTPFEMREKIEEALNAIKKVESN